MARVRMRFLELVGLNAIFPHNTRARENRHIYHRQYIKDCPPSKQLKSINNITEACEKGHRFWARNDRGYVPGRTREGAIIRYNGANVQDGMYVLGKTLDQSHNHDTLLLNITNLIYLRCKGWQGILNNGSRVFAKLWDGWKLSASYSEHEANVYEHLRDL